MDTEHEKEASDDSRAVINLIHEESRRQRVNGVSYSADHTTSVRFIRVTPELASLILEYKKHNRVISEILVDSYARDMVEGRWHIIPNGIGLDADGRLVDGEHRITAISMGAKELASRGIDGVEMPLYIGVTDAARLTIDAGMKRTTGQLLGMTGYKNSSMVAATSRLLMLYQEKMVGINSVRRYSNQEIQTYVDEHFEEMYHGVSVMTSRRVPGISPAVLLAATVLFGRLHREEAAWFVEHLYTGEDLEVGSPILALRNRLAEDMARGIKSQQARQLYLLIKTWNAWRSRERMKYFRLPGQYGGAMMLEPK